MFKFRPYQSDIIEQGSTLLKNKRILLLAMQVRTGKTFTALGIAQKVNSKKVLFITKKKAMLSIQSDYETLSPDYGLILINYESVHKIKDKDIDLVIVDESHSLGAYPKPSLRTKRIKEIIGNKYCVLLTGTPTPESWSQIYHQFWISNFTPFQEPTFYKWSKNYVDVTERMINGYKVNNYSNCYESKVKSLTNSHTISFTQKEAGFTSKVNEHILKVQMKPTTYQLIKRLEKDKVYEGKKGGVILGDTAVKLMQKVHQLCSGTVKLECGKSVIIDNSKAIFIKEHFKNKKIGIFYKFKAELDLLKEVFGDNITTDLSEFNNSSKNIALQIVSGREGTNLSKADYLVFFNIDFSATSYFQAKDRLTTKERLTNDVYWVFSNNGIENQIYRKVMDKKNFTINHYERGKISS